MVIDVLNIGDHLALTNCEGLQTANPNNYMLLEGLRCWDVTIIRYIYDHYYQRIEDFIARNKGRKEDAKDLFHDTLIVLNKKFNEQLPELRSDFYFFFFTVCRRMWLNHLRRMKKEVLFDDRTYVDVMESMDNLVPSLYDVDTGEKEKLFTDHFKRLDKECRQLLLLRFTNTSYKSIAKEMNFENEQQARNKKHYCVRKLVKSIQSDKRYTELKSK